MSETQLPDEQPKKQVAKRVITRTRRYFLPAHNVSVKATSLDQAVAQVTKANNKKVGDG